MTYNNGVKNATVTQWWTDKHLFSVQIWDGIVSILDSYPGTLDDTPVKKL